MADPPRPDTFVCGVGDFAGPEAETQHVRRPETFDIVRGRARYRLGREERRETKGEPRLLQALEAALADEPRRGAPATFTPEQIVALMALAREDPADRGRPVTHWRTKR